MSSLKDAAAVLQELHPEAPQNKYDMSVTPRVPHSEMCPYVASAAALSESHAATAVRMLVSSKATVGAGVAVGAGLIVGAGDGAQAPSACVTPQDVDSHGVPSNGQYPGEVDDDPQSFTSSSTHQLRSWSKAEAP